MRQFKILMTLGFALALGVGCSSSKPGGSLVDANGESISTIDSGDPVTVALTGLDPNTQYRLVVTDPAGTELNPSGGFIATTDEEGKIPDSTVVQDLDSAELSRLRAQVSGLRTRAQAAAGTYTLTVNDMDGGEVFQTDFTVVDGSKVFCADNAGTARGSFLPSEAVYAKITKGEGSLADGTYTCFVVPDGNAVLQDGDSLVGTTSQDLTVTGGTGTVNLGTFAAGAYDVVCDIDDDGEFTAGTDLISRARRFHACFTTQTAHSGSDVVGQICSDRNGNYRDVFDPNATDPSIRDVWAWISPPEKNLVDHRIGVRKYVVEHQDSYTDGETLVDVTGDSGGAAFELDAVQAYCTNESPWLTWPRQLLTAGCYDCIIDVNADGKYTTGEDYLDNIDLTGEATCGMRVASTSCEEWITVESPEDGSEVDTTTTTIEGTIEEAGSSGSITITSGTKSNRIQLDVSTTTINATVPLFHGENLITIAAVKADGTTTCSRTIKVTSTAEGSANELFRAQLTWATGDDMDLHVINPGGSVETNDDCYYGNCKTAVGGLDWGNEGKAELDVDCISGCSRIENIWLVDIGQSGTYTVYVKAFSGTGTSVNVSLFIRGTQVATVPCGTMTSSTGTYWCKVGTVNWSGSETGNGAFTPIGTLGATP